MIVSCDRLSLEVNDIRFVYKGHYVLAEETPDQVPSLVYICISISVNAVFTIELVKSD